MDIQKEGETDFVSIFPSFYDNMFQRQDRPTPRLIRLSTNNTRKTKNKILAIPAAPAAIPPNQSTPAIMATIRNMTVHLSMIDKSLES